MLGRVHGLVCRTIQGVGILHALAERAGVRDVTKVLRTLLVLLVYAYSIRLPLGMKKPAVVRGGLSPVSRGLSLLSRGLSLLSRDCSPRTIKCRILLEAVTGCAP